MIEDGVEQPYTELWQRVDRGESTKGTALVMKLLDDDTSGDRGWFVAVGNHFILAIDRRRSRRTSPLDMEISRGLRRGVTGDWIIANSTHPWREGRPAFDDSTMRVDWIRRTAIEQRASGGTRSWRVLEPVDGAVDWFPASATRTLPR